MSHPRPHAPCTPHLRVLHVTRCERSLRPDTISAFRQRAHADIQRIRKRVMGRTVETFCGLLFLALACEAQYIQDPIVGSNNPVPVVPNHMLMPSVPHINTRTT